MNLRDEFANLGLPDPGVHPETGEAFVSAELECDHQMEKIHRLPPPYPEKYTCIYDDEGNLVSATPLSDEVFAAHVEMYEKAKAEWDKTGGMHVVKSGPDIYTAKFTTATGNIAQGICGKDHQAWKWTYSRSTRHFDEPAETVPERDRPKRSPPR